MSSSPSSSSSLYGSNASATAGRQVELKHCWVCFASEDDDYTASWTSPCKCRGTAKWVHKSCLQRWIDEKQQGNSSIEVACPQCNSTYIIIYPKCGMFVKALDIIDRLICKACPFLAGSILVGSVFWTAVTYGAVTVMQVLGHKEGLNLMEKADPLILLIGLPTIPVMLMMGRLIRWEDAVLKFWRKHSTKLPLLNMIFPSAASNQYLPRMPTVSFASNSDPVSFTRTICGGLILPTIATLFGKILFQRVSSNFQRTIIGGIAFIGLKGMLKIYYKQQQYLRQAHRQVKNYEPATPPPPPPAPHIHATVTSSSSSSSTMLNTSYLTSTNSMLRHPPTLQEPATSSDSTSTLVVGEHQPSRRSRSSTSSTIAAPTPTNAAASAAAAAAAAPSQTAASSTTVMFPLSSTEASIIDTHHRHSHKHNKSQQQQQQQQEHKQQMSTLNDDEDALSSLSSLSTSGDSYASSSKDDED